ncbi:hypothetical protein [Burkholderia anthina]|uniref:hypothetical protein n=1 Tax=Burkholderia anthina TaxID=179879 RepID=UPI00158CD624
MNALNMMTRIATATASIAISLFLPTLATAACRGSQNLPSQQFFVSFSQNSFEISEFEQDRLHQWILKMNSRYPIQNWIDVIGSASKNEVNYDLLARKRASEVAKIAIGNGLINAPFQIQTEIYPASSIAEATSDAREVTVQVSPGCPDNCCDGM